MGLFDILKDLVSVTKKVDVKHLPSQGFFYPTDFKIEIKKAKIEDIVEYEYKYDEEDLFKIIENIKIVVERNTILNYKFEDLKSVDVIFLFLEIVMFTINKRIKIEYYDDLQNKSNYIEFGHETYNYFDFDKYMEFYNEVTREFVMDGYSFSLPSIGIENTLTNFLMTKSITEPNVWTKYSYDFLYFLGNKSSITFDEVENIVTIFNIEMEEEEIIKISNITKRFHKIIGYSLKKDGKVIDIKSKLNLLKIWE
jgi:hypothetical protein